MGHLIDEPGDWHLGFHAPGGVDLARLRASIGALGPMTSEILDRSGNPRDGFFRKERISVEHAAGMRFELEVGISEWPVDGMEEPTEVRGATLRAPTAAFAAKLSAWQALRDTLAPLGYTDTTLAGRPGQIVDDAVAAGETALGARWRSEITATLIAAARKTSWLILQSQRPDDMNAVLAAYPEPEQVEKLYLDDCRLSALPASLARFVSIDRLGLDGAEIDGNALRVLSFPKLTYLTLRRSAVRELRREDLAGFPALDDLRLEQSQLRALDPGILEACPKLAQLVIIETPLVRDEAAIAALRARWPGVKLYLEWDKPGS